MASDRAKRQWTRHQQRGWTETVTWRPAGGTARTIQAQVDRGPRENQMHAAVAALRATVLVDDTLGVPAASAIDKGLDQLELAERRGGTARCRHIRDLSDQDDDDFLTLVIE